MGDGVHILVQSAQALHGNARLAVLESPAHLGSLVDLLGPLGIMGSFRPHPGLPLLRSGLVQVGLRLVLPSFYCAEVPLVAQGSLLLDRIRSLLGSVQVDDVLHFHHARVGAFHLFPSIIIII